MVMERPWDMEKPPPVPPRSPLREAADLDISGIFQDPLNSDEEADAGLQIHFKALRENIDYLIDRLRPESSSTSLVSTERTPRKRAKPYLHFASGVASASSIYSQDWDTFDPYRSSAPTSSRPSYSSSHPISTSSTHTIYSTISTSPPTEAAIHQTPAPVQDASTPTAHPAPPKAQQLFDVVEQLPPIIYRPGTMKPSPAADDADNDDETLFPPHPGVRPPSISRPSLDTQTPPPLPTTWLFVPKRAASLRFSLRKRRML